MVSTTLVSVVLRGQHFYFLVAVTPFAEAESRALTEYLVSVGAVRRGLLQLQVADALVQRVHSVSDVDGLSRACHLLLFRQLFDLGLQKSDFVFVSLLLLLHLLHS